MPKHIDGDRLTPQVDIAQKPETPQIQKQDFWQRIEFESRKIVEEIERALSGATTAAERKRAKKKAARRMFKEGFPVFKPFGSIDEARKYFAEPELTCLICGNKFLSLGGHIGAIHRVSEEEYKAAYGIPSTYGLVCPETKEKHSEISKERLSIPGEMERRLGGRTPQEQAAMARKHLTREKLTGSPYKGQVASANLGQHRKDDIPDEVFERILSLMVENDLLLREVLERFTGLPKSHSVVYRWINEIPARRKRYDAIVESLSFPAQIRGECLGERFLAEVRRLRKDGKTVHDIAEALGVHAMTVQKRFDRMKREGDALGNALSRPIRTHCTKGHPLPDGKGPCRVCNTEYSRKRRGSLPREIAAKTMVQSTCTKCGVALEMAKVSATRKVRVCAACRKAGRLEWMSKKKEAK